MSRQDSRKIEDVKVMLVKGADGSNIQSIEKTGTSGVVDTYTVTLTDSTTYTFTVTNGSNIQSIAKTGTSGLVDTYTVTLTNGDTSTFTVTNGKGITSIAKTSSQGLVDTYTITYNDGTTSTFEVTNSNVVPLVDRLDLNNCRNLVVPADINYTARGIIMRTNSDGSITLSGANTYTSDFILWTNLFDTNSQLATDGNPQKWFPNGKYMVYGDTVGGRIRPSSTTLACIRIIGLDADGNVVFNVSSNTATYNNFTVTDSVKQIMVRLWVDNGADFGNGMTIYPMITTQSTENVTEYEQGSLSNRALTLKLDEKQKKTDDSLQTTNKTIVGAINELKGRDDGQDAKLNALGTYTALGSGNNAMFGRSDSIELPSTWRNHKALQFVLLDNSRTRIVDCKILNMDWLQDYSLKTDAYARHIVSLWNGYDGGYHVDVELNGLINGNTISTTSNYAVVGDTAGIGYVVGLD